MLNTGLYKQSGAGHTREACHVSRASQRSYTVSRRYGNSIRLGVTNVGILNRRSPQFCVFQDTTDHSVVARAAHGPRDWIYQDTAHLRNWVLTPCRGASRKGHEVFVPVRNLSQRLVSRGTLGRDGNSART